MTMGALSSHVPGPKIVPSTVLPTPAHLEHELLELLYECAVPLLEYRRTIFYMNATEEPENYDCYWTLETFIRFLSSRHPGKESLVEIAGPLLFRIIIYYGSFPFHPKTQVRMSCEVFLRGTQLLSEQGQALLLRRSYEYEFREDLVSRHRLCSDDIRVFFRSMAIPRPRDASEIDIQERNEDDDRDLLDVMISIMKKKKTETESIWGYSRNELLAVAHTLPSSSSQATEGFIRHEEICALLDLLKTSKPTKAPVDIDRDPASVPFWRYVCECFDEEWGSWIVDRSSNDVSHHSLDDLLHTLQHPDMHSEPILWKPFCYLLQGIHIPFMEPLCDFVEQTFDQPQATVIFSELRPSPLHLPVSYAQKVVHKFNASAWSLMSSS